MARRFSAPYQSEPVSSLATWARNLAVFSVVAVVVSILIVRFGFLEMKPALATFFGALACAGLSILVGLAAFVAIWQNGSRGVSATPLGVRRAFPSGWVGRLCRDLAERLARHEPHPAGAVDRRGRARLSGLSRPAISQAAADPRHHHRSDASPALRRAGAAAHRRRRQHRGLCRAVFRRTAAAGLSRYRDGGTRRSRATGL